MQHRARLVLGEQCVERGAVADICADKNVFGIGLLRLERTQVAGIGQLVYIQHRFVRGIEPVEHEISADKAGTARYQDHEIPL